MRCFIAVGHRTDLAKSVGGWLDQGRQQFPELSVTPAANLHLTLAFLGEIDADQVKAAKAAVAAAAAWTGHGWELGWGEPGAFPGRRRPGVLWLGAGSGVDRLREVQAALVKELGARGLPLDAKRYRPHLTLARVRRPLAEERAAAIGEWLASLPPVPPLAVDALVLFRSTLGRPAAVHTPVATAPLGRT